MQHTPGKCLSDECPRMATATTPGSGGNAILCHPCLHAYNRGVKAGERNSAAPDLLAGLERLSSGEGFIAVGMIPEGQWGDEIKARQEFAQDVIDKAKP